MRVSQSVFCLCGVHTYIKGMLGGFSRQFLQLLGTGVVGSECAGCEREAAHSQEDEVSLWEGGWSRQLGVVSCG